MERIREFRLDDPRKLDSKWCSDGPWDVIIPDAATTLNDPVLGLNLAVAD